jgi:hypothetical protein
MKKIALVAVIILSTACINESNRSNETDEGGNITTVDQIVKDMFGVNFEDKSQLQISLNTKLLGLLKWNDATQYIREYTKWNNGRQVSVYSGVTDQAVIVRINDYGRSPDRWMVWEIAFICDGFWKSGTINSIDIKQWEWSNQSVK